MVPTYRDRLSGRADKALFVIAWIGGTAGLLLLKVFRPDWDFVIIGWTAAVLIAYAIAIWRSPKFKVREDRAGDSCYYLGFLFTLSSLAYALWQFRQNTTDARTVIANFAVTLTSTILGLVLRVIFQQFREDPFEVEQEVRLELSDAANRLKNDVLQLVEEFGTLRTAVGQELRNEFTRSVTKIAADCADAIKATTEEQNKALKAALTGIGEIAISMKTQVASVRTSSKRSADAFDALADRLEKAELPTASLEREIQRIVTFVSDAIEHEAAQLDSQRQRLDTIATAANETKTAMEQVAGQAKDFGEGVRGIVTAAGGIASIVETWKETLTTGTKNWSNATKAEQEAIKVQIEFVTQSARDLERLRKSLDLALSESQTAVVKTQRSLASLADTLVEQL